MGFFFCFSFSPHLASARRKQAPPDRILIFHYSIITGQGWPKACFFFRPLHLSLRLPVLHSSESRVCESHPSPRLQAIFKTLKDKAPWTPDFLRDTMLSSCPCTTELNANPPLALQPLPNPAVYRFSRTTEGFPLFVSSYRGGHEASPLRNRPNATART